MRGNILIFVGIILIGVGVLVAYTGGGVTVNKKKVSEDEAKNIKQIVGISVGGLGALFCIFGFMASARYKKQVKRNQYILQNGKDAVGNVTFVDRNWSIKVNGQPIYSHVEYVYKDNLGQQYTRRISNLKSDIVIRQKIEVGGTVPIRYLQENPGESVLMISV